MGKLEQVLAMEVGNGWPHTKEVVGLGQGEKYAVEESPEEERKRAISAYH